VEVLQKEFTNDRDRLKAAAQGKFAVYAVRSVDEGIELLTGAPAQDIHARVEAGTRRANSILGEFPCVNSKREF